MLSQHYLCLLTITSLLKRTFYFDHSFNCSLHNNGCSIRASFFCAPTIFRENRTLFSKTFLLFPLKISKTPRVHTDTNKWWNKLTKEGETLCRRIPNNYIDTPLIEEKLTNTTSVRWSRSTSCIMLILCILDSVRKKKQFHFTSVVCFPILSDDFQ